MITLATTGRPTKGGFDETDDICSSFSTFAGLNAYFEGVPTCGGAARAKEELGARGESKAGNKAWLRRRLHAAIVRDHLADGDEL